MVAGTKPSVSNPRALFFPCVVQKETAYFDIKVLNMRHQSQKGFWSIFVGIQQHQKGYLIYVPSTQEIISLYEFLFDGGESNAFAYTSRPYSEAIEMRTAVSYILYAGYSHEQTGGIITFSQVE